MAAPKFVAGNILGAMRAGEFDISHSRVRRLMVQNLARSRGRHGGAVRLLMYTTLCKWRQVETDRVRGGSEEAAERHRASLSQVQRGAKTPRPNPESENAGQRPSARISDSGLLISAFAKSVATALS
jgi:hypothetical protein